MDRKATYRIERLLGAGGMGQVFLGVHETTGRQAAVKMLPAQMAHEQGLVIRFSREIDAMRRWSAARTSSESLRERRMGGDVLAAMEHVAGETLAEKLYREKRIPWRTVIDYAVQICRALKSAHNSGIIHRDLKPSNLLIDEAGAHQADRLRRGPGLRRLQGHHDRRRDRHRGIHVSRAGPGKRVTKQSDIYSLGRGHVRDADGPAAVHRQEHPRHRPEAQVRPLRQPAANRPRHPPLASMRASSASASRRSPRTAFRTPMSCRARLQEIPKKVDLALSGTIDVDGARGTEETAPAIGEFDHGQVGGTLMRDLIRGEIARQHEQKSPGEGVRQHLGPGADAPDGHRLGGVVVVAAGPSPEQLFARGEELMAEPAGPAWDEARREVFEPLLLEDRETWEPKIEPYLRKLALYDFRKSFLGRRGAKGEKVPRTELERFLPRRRCITARWDRPPRARRLLISLADVLRSQPDSEATVSMVDAMVEELDAQPEATGIRGHEPDPGPDRRTAESGEDGRRGPPGGEPSRTVPG